MERLTQWYDDGKIRGVLVKDGYEENSLQTIITKIDECYAAATLLKEYEDTDLTTEQIRDLKERDKSKPPIYQVQGDERYEQEPEWWMCPECEEVYDMDEDYDFCPNCGQRILR